MHQGNPGQVAPYSATTPGPRPYWLAAGVGALLGAAGAAAKNARLCQQGKLDGGGAVRDTLKEAAGLGLAAAAGVAAGQALRLAGLAGLLGVAAVASGAKYLWDSALQKSEAPLPAAACCDEPTATTAPAKAGKAKKN